MSTSTSSNLTSLRKALGHACRKLGIDSYYTGYSEYRAQLLLARFYPLVSEAEIDRVLSSKSLFFMPNTGRSGSKFMAELLNKSANAVVSHEPIPQERFARLEALQSAEKGRRYIEDFRRKQIYLLVRDKTEPIYGETNSYLRNHIDYIVQQLPSVKLIHLVRNPKRVIPSMMVRDAPPGQLLSYKPPVVASIKLTPREWSAMSFFERACHIWREENAFIRERVPNFVRLEGVVGDYDYFKANVLETLGLDVSRETWEAMASRPVNASTRNDFPQFENWSRSEVAAFERICADEMAHYGYFL